MKKILCFGDTHFPFSHIDTIPFLAAVKSKHKITSKDYVIHLGDELDYNALNFHAGPDPDLLSASDELRLGIKKIKELYKLFPKVTVIESNHGSLVWRRQRHHGLPREAIKPYKSLLKAPTGWRWLHEYLIKINKDYYYFHHHKTSISLKLSQTMGLNAIQAHTHQKLSVDYWTSPNQGVLFDIHCGCLIDFDSIAFRYARNNLKKPMLGCCVINGKNVCLEPLIENSKKRWVGKLNA